MSPRDVHGNEMDGNFDFNDETTEEFLRGTARDVDPQLADVIGDMRVAYTSTPPAVGPELAAFIGATEPASVPQPRRFERMRSSIFAKIGAATAAVVAATGGLAVAGALPAPMQDAMSHIGVGSSSHHSKSGSEVSPGDNETTTTMVGSGETTTEPGDDSTTPTSENHGDEVNGVAHDGTGCEHGQAVAAVASDGRSQHPDCPTTPTSIGDHKSGEDSTETPDTEVENDGGDHHSTTPTSTGTSGGQHDGGGDSHGGSDGGGHDGGSDGGGGN